MSMPVIIPVENRPGVDHKQASHVVNHIGQSRKTGRSSESDRPADGELYSEAERMIDDVQVKNGRKPRADRA